MNVRELIDLLETYEGSLEVIVDRFSDYTLVTAEACEGTHIWLG